MNRRAFLIGCAASLAGLSARPTFMRSTGARPVSRIPDTSGMSLLLITVDGLNADTIGCYGLPLVKTPNLDRFATRATRFARCYCQWPVSGPSRNSFLTGLRPNTINVPTDSDSMDCVDPAGTQSLLEVLHRYHFRTADVGRLLRESEQARGQSDASDRVECDDRPAGRETGAEEVPKEPHEYADYSPDATREDAKDVAVGKPGGACFGDSGCLDEQEPDAQKARLAARILTDIAGQEIPFFVSVDFSKPSTLLRCPRKYLDLYDLDHIPAPQAAVSHDRNIPAIARRLDRGHDLLNDDHEGPTTDVAARRAIQAYYARVSFVDTQIGIVLDALDQAGLSDETIVVILSDHGFHLGEHGLWGDGTLFERSTHVPLMIRVPRVTTREVVCDEIIELVDLLPTVCDLLTVPVPENLEGKSFVPLLSDPLQPWKRAAFAVCTVAGHLGRSVRTKRWRYADWQSGAGSPRRFELYDLDTDPWEQTNLALNPAYRNERTILANLLQRGWQAVQ